MQTFGQACKDCFPEILSLIPILSSGKAIVRFIAFGDYDSPNSVVEISGPDNKAEELLNRIAITADADFPEASKTAFFELLREIEQQDTAGGSVRREHLVFLFTGTFTLFLTLEFNSIQFNSTLPNPSPCEMLKAEAYLFAYFVPALISALGDGVHMCCLTAALTF
jgi:hypothetical protein